MKKSCFLYAPRYTPARDHDNLALAEEAQNTKCLLHMDIAWLPIDRKKIPLLSLLLIITMLLV